MALQLLSYPEKGQAESQCGVKAGLDVCNVSYECVCVLKLVKFSVPTVFPVWMFLLMLC